MVKNSVIQRESSEILNDNLLSKIIEYLKISEISRVAFVSKQFRRCLDLVLSKKKSITICTTLSAYTDINSFEYIFYIVRFQDLHHFYKNGIDLNDIQNKYETLFLKFKNLKQITFLFGILTKQMVDWLAKIFSYNMSIILSKGYRNYTGFYKGITNWTPQVITSLIEHFGPRISYLDVFTDFVSEYDLSEFKSLKKIRVEGEWCDDSLCFIKKWPQSLQVLKILEFPIKSYLMQCLSHSNAAKNLSLVNIIAEENFKDTKVFQMFGQNFPSLNTLKISIKSLDSIDSLFSMNKLNNFENLHLFLRIQSEMCFHSLIDTSLAMKSLQKLKIRGEYRLKNIRSMNQMFPKLKELFLFNFQIECKFSESETVCFDCIYNQIKDLIVLSQFAKLQTLEVHFSNDIEFSFRCRMFLKAMFEAIIDCNQCLDIHLTSKDEEIKINCFIDLIMFSSLVSNEKIFYFFGKDFLQKVEGYRNLYPQNSSVSIIETGDSYLDLFRRITKNQLLISWTEYTDFSEFSFNCDKYNKNSKIEFWI